VRRLADDVDRRLLLVEPREQIVWAWLGGRRRLDHDEFLQRAASDVPPHLAIAVGEPALGRAGWRLSHRQAAVISSYSRRELGKVTRYADVGLLAAVSKDQVLVESLNQLYLSPLASGRDGGAALRDTLRAYFSAGRNISSAAAALAVNRDTVSNRLRTVEQRLGRSLEDIAAELDIALRLE
jgi:DNA-binding PucR family transcriptional regulator